MSYAPFLPPNPRRFAPDEHAGHGRDVSPPEMLEAAGYAGGGTPAYSQSVHTVSDAQMMLLGKQFHPATYRYKRGAGMN